MVFLGIVLSFAYPISTKDLGRITDACERAYDILELGAKPNTNRGEK